MVLGLVLTDRSEERRVDSMTSPPQPIPLDEPAVQKPVSIPDADSFTDFDEYINTEMMLRAILLAASC